MKTSGITCGANAGCRPTSIRSRHRLEDAEERKRLAKIFEQGLGKVVGYALPLRRRHDGTTSTWQTGPWFLRSQHLFLLPGDSPMGFRLPLDSLLWETPDKVDRCWSWTRSLRADRCRFLRSLTLPARRSTLPAHRVRSVNDRVTVPGRRSCRSSSGKRTCCPKAMLRWPMGSSTATQTHQASFARPCASSRAMAGCTCSCRRSAISRIISTWSPPWKRRRPSCSLPVLIEGYAPPADHRLSYFHITPDPGVMEVNIHPANSWDELVENTKIIYEEARQTRLCTEKFMLDGRHTGTGGGNHIVLGGPSPADSPMLRRPDLLKQPDRLLAQSPVAVVPVLRPVRRAHQPGAAHRRGPQRQPL